MSKQHYLRILAMLTLSGFMLMTAVMIHAQVKQGKTRAAKTAQLMKGVMKPHCTELKNGLETDPSNDEAWEKLATHAAVLNELSYLLMDDGRCPDRTWADAASKTLRQGSAEVLKAVEAKDATAAKDAFGSMTKACKACHDAHKEKK